MTVHPILSSEENKNQGSSMQKSKIFCGTTWAVHIPFTVLHYERTVDSVKQHAHLKLFLEV